MVGLDFAAVLENLTDGGNLDGDQLELISVAGEAVIGWDVDEYVEAFQISRLEALAMRKLVHDAFASMGVTDTRAVTIPDAPPYLKDPGTPAIYHKTRDEAGTLQVKTPATTGDYDPADPTQFTQIGDQYYRWDGQRNERYPAGQPQEIVFVEHRNVNGVQVPDPAQSAEATKRGQGWFHKGYGCWIRPNGKRSVELTQEQLTAQRNVIGPRARVLA